jgi:hypothetical protein
MNNPNGREMSDAELHSVVFNAERDTQLATALRHSADVTARLAIAERRVAKLQGELLEAQKALVARAHADAEAEKLKQANEADEDIVKRAAADAVASIRNGSGLPN